MKGKIFKTMSPGELPREPIAVPASSRMRSRVRSIHRKEDTYRGAATGDLDFEARMEALGLGLPGGRTEWRAQRGRIMPGQVHADDDDWDEAALALDRAETVDRQIASAVVDSRVVALQAEIAKLRARPAPALVPVPAPAEQIRQRPQLGELRVTARNTLGQISKLANAQVALQVTARREGRIASVSVTPADGEPYRLCVKRDELGRLVGLQIEDA